MRWSHNGRRGLGCSELGNPTDHIPHGLQSTQSVVRYLNGKGLFNLKRDVNLVQRVDVEFVKRALEGDGVRGYALRFGDDFNAAAGDIVHGVPTSSLFAQLTGMPAPM